MPSLLFAHRSILFDTSLPCWVSIANWLTHTLRIRHRQFIRVWIIWVFVSFSVYAVVCPVIQVLLLGCCDDLDLVLFSLRLWKRKTFWLIELLSVVGVLLIKLLFFLRFFDRLVLAFFLPNSLLRLLLASLLMNSSLCPSNHLFAFKAFHCVWLRNCLLHLVQFTGSCDTWFRYCHGLKVVVFVVWVWLWTSWLVSLQLLRLDRLSFSTLDLSEGYWMWLRKMLVRLKRLFPFFTWRILSG